MISYEASWLKFPEQKEDICHLYIDSLVTTSLVLNASFSLNDVLVSNQGQFLV